MIQTTTGQNSLDPTPNPTPDRAAAQDAFATFLHQCDSQQRLVCLHDSDADGVTAGVIWQCALQQLGFKNIVRLAPNRERNAWTHSNRERVRVHQPERLWVLDLGCAPDKVLEEVPTCFVDHHYPEGVPPGDTLISVYSWNPIPNTSLLVYELFTALTDITLLDWIAAMGTISDLGERAPFELIATTKKKYTAKYLKEATTLINAARRASHHDPEVAARALLSHASPRELVESQSADSQALREAREEVKRELEEAKKAAPVFAGKVALIRVHSACQIHPLIAQIWRTRLPKFIVIAANDAYLEGRVNFSCRAAAGTSVLEFLRAIDVPGEEGSFGHGHDQASGGSLPIERWNALLQALGFAPSVWAQG